MPQESKALPAAASISPGISSVIGALAGIIEVGLQQPAVSWKNALQDRRPVPLNLRELYRGVVINAGSMAPINAIQFGVNTLLEQQLGQGAALSEAAQVGVAATAGAVSSIVGGPAELLMIQQQKAGGSLPFQAARLRAHYGIVAFATGLLPTMIRESIYAGTYLGLNPVLRNRLMTLYPSAFERQPTAAMMLTSVPSGLLAAVITQPLDAAKTRMQGNLDHAPYRSLASTLGLMWREGGVGSLWSGILPRALRITLAVFILGESRERLSAAYLRHWPQGTSLPQNDKSDATLLRPR